MSGEAGPGVDYLEIQIEAAGAERLAKQIFEECNGDPGKIKVALDEIAEAETKKEVRGCLGWLHPALIKEGHI